MRMNFRTQVYLYRGRRLGTEFFAFRWRREESVVRMRCKLEFDLKEASGVFIRS
jgi:hypothetical protein